MSNGNIFRLAVYAAIPFIGTIGTGIDGNMDLISWTKLLCLAISSSLVAVRAYIDKSLTQESALDTQPKA